MRSSSDECQRAVWVGLLAAVGGHVVDLQFGFELTTSGTTFWLLLAMAAGLARGNLFTSPPYLGNEESEGGGRVEWLPYLLPALLVLILILLVCVRPLLADVAYQRSLAGEQPVERLEAAARAVRLWPLEPQYWLSLAAISLEAGDFEGVEVQLEAAEQLSPDDPRVWAAQGEVYAAWGQWVPAQLGPAEMAYRQALALAPDMATYHAGLGVVLTRQGRLEEGVEELERAVDLDATYGMAYGQLADLYLVLGREADAAWAEREAVRWSGEGSE
jgi:tetratricopeptide (TPR) repeat protein